MLITEYPVKNLSSDDDLYLISTQGKVNTIRHKTLLKDVYDNIDKINLSLDAVKTSAEEASQKVNSMESSIEDLGSTNQTINEKIAEIETEIENQGISITEMGNSLTEVGTANQNLRAELTELSETVEEQDTSLTQLANSVGTMLTDVNVLKSSVSSLQTRVMQLESTIVTVGEGNVKVTSVEVSITPVDLLTNTETFLSVDPSLFSDVDYISTALSMHFSLALYDGSNALIETYRSPAFSIPIEHTKNDSDEWVTDFYKCNIKVEFYPHVWCLLQGNYDASSGLYVFKIVDKDLTQLVTTGSSTQTYVSKANFTLSNRLGSTSGELKISNM